MARKSLQQITDAWGEWMNTKHDGGGVWFTESTKYKDHSRLKDYLENQVSVTYQSLTYDLDAPLPPPGQVSSFSTEYVNDGPKDQSLTYTSHVETRQSFKWSITESLDVGVEVTATEGIPDVAQVEEKVTAKITLSSTQEAETEKTQSWDLTVPIIVSEMSRLKATLVVVTQDYDIGWTATCVLEGHVAIWFNKKVSLTGGEKHWLWFVPIGQVLSDCKKNKLVDTTGYEASGRRAFVRASGTFTGGQGVCMCIDLHSTPIEPTSGRAELVYSIPIDSRTGRAAVIAAADEVAA